MKATNEERDKHKRVLKCYKEAMTFLNGMLERDERFPAYVMATIMIKAVDDLMPSSGTLNPEFWKQTVFDSKLVATTLSIEEREEATKC